MPLDDLVYAGHMLDLARKVVERLGRSTRADFESNEDLRLALTHLIQTIGEAARHVSDEFKMAHPAIPWADAIGMRHKVVHDYMNVDDEIVWDVASKEVPALVKELERVLPQEPSRE